MHTLHSCKKVHVNNYEMFSVAQWHFFPTTLTWLPFSFICFCFLIYWEIFVPGRTHSFPSHSVFYPFCPFVSMTGRPVITEVTVRQVMVDRKKTNRSDFYYVLCFSHAFKYLTSGLGNRDQPHATSVVVMKIERGDNNTLGHGKTHLHSECFQHLTARQPCENSSLFPPPICLFSLKLRYWDVFINAPRYLCWNTAWQFCRKYLVFLQS